MNKLITFFKKQKIIFFLGSVLGILIIVRIILQKPQAPTPPKESPFPSGSGFKKQVIPSGLPEPTPEEKIEDKVLEQAQLKLINVYPKAGENETLSSQYKIVFTFNQEVELEGLVYKIEPEISLEPTADKNNLSFYPRSPFKYDIPYTLTLEGLESKPGSLLNNPIKYIFQLHFPERMIFNENH